MAHWGFLFLRRPLAFPVAIAVLNVFVLRANYFRATFVKRAQEMDARALLVKDLPSNLRLNTTHFTSLRARKCFTGVAALYVIACGLLLVANVVSGTVVVCAPRTRKRSPNWYSM